MTDPLGHTTTYGYDAVNNQTAITNTLGHATTYGYDALNRRTSITDPLGNTTSYTYDPDGNRTSLSDANGKITTYSYDSRNLLISVTDAMSGTVTYSYDANGNRLSMTDANVHTTTYTYDALNRLATVTDPLLYVTSYTYDNNGNRITETKPDTTVVSYSYDPLDRLEQTSYPGGTIQYAYDVVGNRTVMTDTLGATTYTYDTLDRLVQTADPNGTLGYGYDLNGNRTFLTYPAGQVVTYTYDAANRLIDVEDWGGRVTTYTYDPANRQTGIEYPNGVQATYNYDIADRLLSIQHTSPVSGTIAAFTYTLDAVGNRLSMLDLEGFSSYQYDDLYRLTQVVYPDGEQVDYAYDPMGNRTAMTSTVSGPTTYIYDPGDRLLSFTDPSGTTSLSWDANGNMTGKGGASYTFDPLDRLTQVVSGTMTVDYAYNGDGVRLGKTVNGTATSYVQDLQSPLPVVLEDTVSGQTNFYQYGRDLIAQVDPIGNLTYYHVDGLGSTRALSNLVGQRTNLYSYDIFGSIRLQARISDQPFNYTGEQTDVETGLMFLRARYYDPTIGRFVSQDPFAGFDEDIQSLNRFSYGRNNPVILTDPSGEIANFLIGGAIGAVAGVGAYTIHALATGQEWKWQKAAVAGVGGAVVGAALPVIAAGVASGGIQLGSLSILGVKGGTALAGAEIAGFVGALKYESNQLIDQKPISLKQAALEFAYEAPFGAVQGYQEAGKALSAVGRGVLKPDEVLKDLSYWYYSQSLKGVPKQLTNSLINKFAKRGLHDLIFRNDVYASSGYYSGGGFGGGGGSSWGGPPSQVK